jgi:hypothetical protein
MRDYLTAEQEKMCLLVLKTMYTDKNKSFSELLNILKIN